jgi:hypothetical protein
MDDTDEIAKDTITNPPSENAGTSERRRPGRKKGSKRHPNTGRRKGSRNKATLLKLEAMKAAPERAKTKSELPMVPPVHVTGREYLESIINSQSPDIDARLRVTAASVLARLEARPPADPSDSAKLINGEGWTPEKAARLEFLQREREKRGQ